MCDVFRNGVGRFSREIVVAVSAERVCVGEHVPWMEIIDAYISEVWVSWGGKGQLWEPLTNWMAVLLCEARRDCLLRQG